MFNTRPGTSRGGGGRRGRGRGSHTTSDGTRQTTLTSGPRPFTRLQAKNGGAATTAAASKPPPPVITAATRGRGRGRGGRGSRGSRGRGGGRGGGQWNPHLSRAEQQAADLAKIFGIENQVVEEEGPEGPEEDGDGDGAHQMYANWRAYAGTKRLKFEDGYEDNVQYQQEMIQFLKKHYSAMWDIREMLTGVEPDIGLDGWKKSAHREVEERVGHLLDALYFTEEPNPVKTLFCGICIYVNGFTYPTAGTLQLLMQLSGGAFTWNYQAGRTTHTIATVLSMAQKKQERARLTTLKPEWILDSLEAGKLLPVHDYKVLKPKNDIKKMFAAMWKRQAEAVEAERLRENQASGHFPDDDIEMAPSAVYVPPPPPLSEQQQQEQQQHATMITVPGRGSPLLFDFDDPIIFAPFTPEMEEEEKEKEKEDDAKASHQVKEQQQQHPPPRPRTPEMELNFSFSDDDDFDVVEAQARLRAGLPAYKERQLDLSGPDWPRKPSKPTALKDPTAPPPSPPPLPASKSKLLDNADPSRPPKAATSGPKKGLFTSLKSSTSASTTTSASRVSTSRAGGRPVFGKHTPIASSSSSSSKPIRAPIPRSVQVYLKNLVPDDQPKATSFSKRIDPKTVVGQNQPNSSIRDHRPRTRPPPPPPVRPDVPLEPQPNVPTILPPLYQIKNTGLRPSERRLRELQKKMTRTDESHYIPVDDYLPESLSQIDPEVLEELPEHIRWDLKTALNLKKVKKEEVELNRGSKAAGPSKVVATKKESKKGGSSKSSKAGKVMTKPAEHGTITQAFARVAAAAFKYPWDRVNEPEVVKKTIVLGDGKVADVTMKIRNDATGAGSVNPPGPKTVPKEKRHRDRTSKDATARASTLNPPGPETVPKEKRHRDRTSKDVTARASTSNSPGPETVPKEKRHKDRTSKDATARASTSNPPGPETVPKEKRHKDRTSKDTTARASTSNPPGPETVPKEKRHKDRTSKDATARASTSNPPGPETVPKEKRHRDRTSKDATAKASTSNPPGPETVPKEKRHKASTSTTPSTSAGSSKTGSSAIPGPSHPATQPKPSTSKAAPKSKPEPPTTFIPDKFAYKGGELALGQLRIDRMIKDRQLELERPRSAEEKATKLLSGGYNRKLGPNLLGKRKLSSVASILRDWFLTWDEPEDDEIAYTLNYFSQLVDSCKFQNLVLILWKCKNWLERREAAGGGGKEMANWKTLYYETFRIFLEAEPTFREKIPVELFWYPRVVEEEEEVPEEVPEVQDGQLVVHVDGQQQDQLENNQAVVQPENLNQLEGGLAEGRHEDQQVNQVEDHHRPQTQQHRRHPKVEVVVLSSQTDIEDLGEDDLNWDDDDLNLDFDNQQQQQQQQYEEEEDDDDLNLDFDNQQQQQQQQYEEEEDDDDPDSSFTFELEPGSEVKYRGGGRSGHRSSRADSTDSEDLDEQARGFKRRSSIDLSEFKKRPRRRSYQRDSMSPEI